jgi:peptidoglycan/xylan/chitin deacetylase (PgdA/CDA1 family)
MLCGFANAMTIDVEDYFQVEAFASTIDRSDWESLPRRVEHNTERLLRILAESGVEATFFILGWWQSGIRSWCAAWWRKGTSWRAMAPAICG